MMHCCTISSGMMISLTTCCFSFLKTINCSFCTLSLIDSTLTLTSTGEISRRGAQNKCITQTTQRHRAARTCRVEEP